VFHLIGGTHLNNIVENGETQFTMERECGKEPNFVGQSHWPVIEIKPVIRHWNIEPGPISIHPIVKILYAKFYKKFK
jgi:hypothetical protein